MATSWNTIKDHVETEKVLEALGLDQYQVSGNEIIMLCPLHDNRNTPSFGVNKVKKVFNCFSCGESGNLADLVAKVKGIEYKEALDWIRVDLAGNPYHDPDAYVATISRLIHFTPEPQTVNDIPVYNRKVIEPWLDKAMEDPSYYESRGISLYTVMNLFLGYDPTHTRRYRVAHTKDWAEWVGPAAIIPVFLENELVGWQERWIGDTPLGLPKYTNTEKFPRRQCVYDTGRNYQKQALTVVVESALTAAYLSSNGFHAIATFGAEANPEQIQQIRSYNTLVIAYDNDKAGRVATLRMVQALKDTNLVSVAPALEEEKSDPGDIPPEDLNDWLDSSMPASLYGEGVM